MNIKYHSQQTWSGFSPTTVPDNNRQSGLSPTTVPKMSKGTVRAVDWDSQVQGLAGPAWTRESESSFKGLARLA